jgi:hypothetical protein
LKVIGFLILLYNAYILDANGFNLMNLIGAVLGVVLLVGMEAFSHVFLIIRENLDAKK